MQASALHGPGQRLTARVLAETGAPRSAHSPFTQQGDQQPSMRGPVPGSGCPDGLKCSELGRCHAINPLFYRKLIFLYPSWLTGRGRVAGWGQFSFNQP